MAKPEEKKEAPKLICPHCEKPIETVEWRPFGDRDVKLVGCGNCLKVIGGTFNVMKM